MWLTLFIVCAVVFFVIFAAKSKDHFQPKPLDIDPALLTEDDKETK